MADLKAAEARLEQLKEEIARKDLVISLLRVQLGEKKKDDLKEETRIGEADSAPDLAAIETTSTYEHQVSIAPSHGEADEVEEDKPLPGAQEQNVTDSTSNAKKAETGGVKRRFRGKRGTGDGGMPSVTVKKTPRHHEFEMPRDLVENPDLDDAIERTLPKNYNFEIKKTLWRIRRCGAKSVAIQLPEGLQLFACPISDLLERFGKVEVFVFADVTYGACCVDDFAARALGCELLVHYGHSCLVPVDITSKSLSDADPTTTQVMYVFVDVTFDVEHMVESIKLEFPDPNSKLAVLGTIQFAGTLHAAKNELDKYYLTNPVVVPQVKPLSSGEVLGCTSPTLPSDLDAFIFVADGRFHLESAMIANPTLSALRYDPYSKAFSREAYDTPVLLSTRLHDVNRASKASKWGVILGTLGRQGNPAILRRVVSAIKEAKPDAEVITLLLSEISTTKLASMENDIQAWVQIACPRLSIDWAEAFSNKPLLTPYECFVALKKVEWRTSVYPQDFYAKGSGPWTNYYEEGKS